MRTCMQGEGWSKDVAWVTEGCGKKDITYAVTREETKEWLTKIITIN